MCRFKLHPTGPKLLVVLVAAFLLSSAGLCWAESYFALSAGISQVEDGEVVLEDFSFFPPATARRSLDFDAGPSYSLRGGHWFDRWPWFGFAGDLSYFDVDAEAANIEVIPLSALLMLRWVPGHNGDKAPRPLYPYFGVGPSFFWYDMNIDLRPAYPERVSDASIDAGWNLVAGLNWRRSTSLALFAEYSYGHYPVEFEERGFFFNNLVSTVDLDIDSHQFRVGLAYHFE